jgi:phospholipid/cholesterol/gamma-HCH transport system substrate-binding protein
MQRNSVETILGAVVLAVAGGFLAFAYKSADLKPVQGYTVTAKFGSVDGLSTGSDVRIGGIKVGVVSSLDLDPESYQAVARLQLRDGVKLPTDSGATVASDGLLGGKYIALEPGADDAMLAAGEEISFTQSSVSIESLIGKLMHSGGGVGEDKAPAAAEPAAN